MNYPALRIYIEPTAVMSARFRVLLESLGLAYAINWQWNAASKYRDGVLTVYAKAAGPQAGVVADALFVRNTHLWTPADERIGKLRSGSPKTQAIMALLAELSA